MDFINPKNLPLSFMVNGEKITLSDSRVKEASTSVEENITSTDFILEDFNLKITAILEVNSDFSASEWYFRFANIGVEDTPIISKLFPFDVGVFVGEDIKDIKQISNTTCFLDEDLNLEYQSSADNIYHLPNGKPQVHYAIGGMCSQDDFKPCDIEISNGTDFMLWAEGGRSSANFLPFFNMNMGDNGYMMAIGWTGDWFANWNRDKDLMNITMGMYHTNFKLYPNEDVRTPKIMIMNYDGDTRKGQNKLRQYISIYHNHVLNVKGEDKVPLFAQHWGDTPCDMHVKNIECKVNNNIDFDYYWIDAAWFGKEDEWPPCTGDWSYIKPNRYPEKFKPITDILKANDKKFLLWFEPERIAPGTEFEKLGDLLIDLPSDMLSPRPWNVGVRDPRFPQLENLRNIFQVGDKLINFAKPEAVDYFVDYFTKFIKENNIDCYRNDANIATDKHFKVMDSEDRQGITEMKWVEGLYKYWDALLENCPGLLIDNCSSGGRRMDIEMFDRSIPLWRTDCVYFTDYKQNHSLGINEWFINQTTGTAILKDGDIEYKVVSNMTAGLNYTFFSIGDIAQPEPDEDSVNYEEVRDILAKYRIMQPYFKGDYYPLTGYSSNSDAVVAYQLHMPETNTGLIVMVRRDDCPVEVATYELGGVDSNKKYDILHIIGDYDLEIENGKLKAKLGEKHSVCCVTYKLK